MNTEESQLFGAELDAHRPLLLGHCYRMLGHPQDAADAVQDTFVRAMRGRDTLRAEASLRAWLVRIATNVCLDELGRRKRRDLPTAGPPGSLTDAIETRPSDEWIAPIPDTWLHAAAPALAARLDGPDERLARRESVRLAFVAALQHLPPRQRAALLLTQVLDWSAAEVATALETTVASVNSALQRARARLAELDPAPAGHDDDAAEELLRRYMVAFERFDMDALAALLTEDVRFSMPPITLWLQGPEQVATFLSAGPGAECRGSRVVPLRANGLPAFAQYRHGGATPWGVVVLEPRGDRIAGITTFLDVDTLFPLFDLPPRWS